MIFCFRVRNINTIGLRQPEMFQTDTNEYFLCEQMNSKKLWTDHQYAVIFIALSYYICVSLQENKISFHKLFYCFSLVKYYIKRVG